MVPTNVHFDAFEFANIGDWKMGSPEDSDDEDINAAHMDIDIQEDEMMHCDFYASAPVVAVAVNATDHHNDRPIPE